MTSLPNSITDEKSVGGSVSIQHSCNAVLDNEDNYNSKADECCNKDCSKKKKTAKRKKKDTKKENESGYPFPCHPDQWVCKKCLSRGYFSCPICDKGFTNKELKQMKKQIEYQDLPKNKAVPKWKSLFLSILPKKEETRVKAIGIPTQRQEGVLQDGISHTDEDCIKTNRIMPFQYVQNETNSREQLFQIVNNDRVQQNRPKDSKTDDLRVEDVAKNNDIQHLNKYKSELQKEITHTGKEREHEKTKVDYIHHNTDKKEVPPSCRQNSRTILNPSSQSAETPDKVDFYPEGLPNIGMTCYANSILQVFGQTPGLQQYLIGRVGELNGKSSFTGSLIKIIDHLNNGHFLGNNDVYRNVKHLLQVVCDRDRSFSIGNQNDSHSFMLALFECIQHEAGSEALGLFEGYFRNIFTYIPCNHTDPSASQLFNSLLVPLPDTEERSVKRGLDIFFQSESLDVHLTCKECQENRKTRKKIHLRRCPEILVLQLGTFDEIIGHSGKKRLVKNDNFVKFEDTLHIPEENGSQYHLYQLYGVVSHSGTLQGGHYTAHVKHGSKWYYCSDSHVTSTGSPTRDINIGAYLLFYSKQKEKFDTAYQIESNV